MEPITWMLGGGGLTVIVLLAKIAYHAGNARRELNGTVDRVKRIEVKLDRHIQEEDNEFKEIRHNVTQIKTKVDLLLENRIKHGEANIN